MEIAKATEGDKARFRSLVEDLPGVEAKAMFGNLGAFVNSNMFAGLFGADIGVKLADDDRLALLAAGGGPFGPAERPMSGYVTLPASLSTAAIQDWISKSLAYVAVMPPKPAKKQKPT
jgi:TfoX/Sxy family transcriptional regulator of competence genes